VKSLLGALACAALLGCKAPEDDVRQTVRDHLKIPYAPDEVIHILDLGPQSALVRIHTEGTVPIYYLTREGRAWKVNYELREDFQKTKLNNIDFEKEFLQRMGTRMQERFNRAINIKAGIPKSASFDESNKTIAAKVSAIFNASPAPGHVMDFWYCETHRFKDGQWTYDSFTLLEKVPMKNEKR